MIILFAHVFLINCLTLVQKKNSFFSKLNVLCPILVLSLSYYVQMIHYFQVTYSYNPMKIAKDCAYLNLIFEMSIRQHN